MRDKPRLYLNQSLKIGHEIELSFDQFHYVCNVMRKKIGDEILVFDGQNGEFNAKITHIAKKSAKIECLDLIRPQTNLPQITLFFAPIKGHRNDNIIEKATEIGTSNINPIITERTIVRKPNIEKYISTSIEAVEQCEGLNLPKIAKESNLIDAVSNYDGDVIFFADEEGSGKYIKDCVSPKFKKIALLIGPEGGFTPIEREKLLKTAKVCAISLGPRILRADSAAICGLSIIQSTWGDWQ